ncbi:hypothetical protein [Wolinella succinogenes]|uniref:hypothetical protein n=1 Tax=Wolinella succinogenes TaxID=844 RepID=UPI002FC6D4F2
MIEANNIREITKKEKIKGLSRTAWALSMIIAGGSFPHILFWNIPFLIFLLCFFYVAEFFDEDIMDIFSAKIELKAKNEYFA